MKQTQTNGGHTRICNPKSLGIDILPEFNLEQFHVYHSINSETMFTEKVEQVREYVGWILAKDLNDAFQKAQNEFNPQYAAYNKRSTSVGDMIVSKFGFYLVKNVGFELICTFEDTEHQES